MSVPPKLAIALACLFAANVVEAQQRTSSPTAAARKKIAHGGKTLEEAADPLVAKWIKTAGLTWKYTFMFTWTRAYSTDWANSPGCPRDLKIAQWLEANHGTAAQARLAWKSSVDIGQPIELIKTYMDVSVVEEGKQELVAIVRPCGYEWGFRDPGIYAANPVLQVTVDRETQRVVSSRRLPYREPVKVSMEK